MARVELTAHLKTLFPVLSTPSGALQISARSVSELIQHLEQTAPGVAFYICDERGRLRRHVNIYVNGEMLVDRHALSDRLTQDSEVFIAQALSGG
jgi:sulfur-carrier protein